MAYAMNAGSTYYPVNNPINIGDVNGPIAGATTAAEAVPTNEAQQMMDGGKPLNWWLGAIVLFVALILGARYLTPGESFGADFKQIKPSVYNILIITLAVAIGLPLLKIVTAKVPMPGLRNYILSI